MPWHKKKHKTWRKKWTPKRRSYTSRAPARTTSRRTSYSSKPKRVSSRRGNFTTASRNLFDPAAAKLMLGLQGDNVTAPIAAAASAAVSAASMSRMTYKGRDSPIPYSYFCKMKYSLSLSNESGNPGIPQMPNSSFAIRGNSIYDPLWATGGKSAQYFTQMSQLWTFYRVHGSKFTARIEANTISDASCIVAVFPTIVEPSSWSAYLPGTTTAFQVWTAPRKHTVVNAFNSGHPFSTIEMYASTKDLFQVPNLADSNFVGTTSATSGTNPTTCWFWGINSLAFNDGSLYNPPNGQIDVEFYVELFCPVKGTDITIVGKPNTEDPDLEGFEDMTI